MNPVWGPLRSRGLFTASEPGFGFFLSKYLRSVNYFLHLRSFWVLRHSSSLSVSPWRTLSSWFQCPTTPGCLPAFPLINSGLEHGSRTSARPIVWEGSCIISIMGNPLVHGGTSEAEGTLKRGGWLQVVGKVLGCILVSNLWGNRSLEIPTRPHNSEGHSLKISQTYGTTFCWETPF